MVKTDESKGPLLKISEVVKATGVSSQTIHYYMREGLLTKPLKTSRNMAYYSPVIIDEIRYIKELQQELYLPIAVIKTMLEARREGQENSHVEEMQGLFEKFFQDSNQVVSGSLSLLEFAEATKLDKETIAAMQQIGLLTPVGGNAGGFDRSDERIGRLAGQLLELGLAPSDLAVFGRYLELTRQEISIVRSKAIDRVHDGSITLTALADLLKELKNELSNKAFRQVYSEDRTNQENKC